MRRVPRAHLPTGAVATGLVITALLLATGCGRQTAVAPATPATPGSSAPSTPSGSAPTPGSSGPADQEKLDAAANAIERLGRSQPDSFTGLAVDVPGDRVVVYRKPSASFDAALARLHTGVRIGKQDAPRSIGELTATRNRVTAMMGHTAGYTIISIGDGSDTSWTKGVVEVGVTGDLARAKKDLGARFGDEVAVAAGQMPVG
jgi:hypothetical protein